MNLSLWICEALKFVSEFHIVYCNIRNSFHAFMTINLKMLMVLANIATVID